MKKWAETKVHEEWIAKGGLERVSDDLCDGLISRTGYHDGTLIFEMEIQMGAIHELEITGTSQCGMIKVINDFVICTINGSEPRRSQRTTVQIPFVFESEPPLIC